MSSQPEEEATKKQQNILFRKTNILGFEVPNVILLLVVVVIAYVLCKDSEKKYSPNELISMKPFVDAYGSNTSAAPPTRAPDVGQSGGFFGKSNKFQFEY